MYVCDFDDFVKANFVKRVIFCCLEVLISAILPKLIGII